MTCHGLDYDVSSSVFRSVLFFSHYAFVIIIMMSKKKSVILPYQLLFFLIQNFIQLERLCFGLIGPSEFLISLSGSFGVSSWRGALDCNICFTALSTNNTTLRYRNHPL